MKQEDLYSELYAHGQQVLKDNNPCKVKNGKCMAGSFCCDGCEHLGPNGCTTEALACKLWLCLEARCTPDGRRATSQFKVLEKIAYEHRVPLYIRASKSQTFSRRW